MKSTSAAVLVAIVCFSLTSNHLLPGDEPHRDAAQDLASLRAERDKYAVELGHNHPRVKQLDREIELTNNLLSRSDVAKQLVPLIVQREQAAAEFGDQHPRVKQLDLEIKATRKYISEAASRKTKKTLNPTEMLDMIQRLVERVDALEQEVAAMKAIAAE